MDRVKIINYRNCIVITPYIKSKWNKETREVEGTCPKLDNTYRTYETFRGHVNRKDILGLYDRKSKTLTLPHGFGLENVKNYLYSNNVLFEVIDKFDLKIEPREVNFDLDDTYVLRNKYQAEAVEFLTSDHLGHSKMLALATGIGKTICSVFGAFRLKVPIFIVSETLTDQWLDKITEYTDCDKSNKGVVILRGSDKLMAMNNWPVTKHKSAFYISTAKTLVSFMERGGNLNELFSKLGIGILCFDEYHMCWSMNMKIELSTCVERLWRLTATPSRTDRSERRIFDKLLNDIPVYGTNTFTVDQHVNIRLVDYDTQPTEEERGSCYTSKGLSSIMYWNYIFDNENRKMYLLGMIKMILDKHLDEYPDTKFLIYLAKKEHIETFRKLLESLYEMQEKDVETGNYTTKIANKRLRKRELKNRIVFTTIGSGGVGLDLENLVATICLVPFSSFITASQMIGRLRPISDKESYHYDFVDKGFRSMDKQRTTRMNVFGPKSKKIAQKTITFQDVKEYIQDII